MTEKQQTAVQHLMQWLSYYNPEAYAELIVKGHYEDALEMEREQIEKAYNQGIEATFQFHYGDGKQHFTDTYQAEP